VVQPDTKTAANAAIKSLDFMMAPLGKTRKSDFSGNCGRMMNILSPGCQPSARRQRSSPVSAALHPSYVGLTQGPFADPPTDALFGELAEI